MDVLDPVFVRHGAREMIVVIPDGWTRYGCGQWVDSPVNGRFEQYVIQDVISRVDSQFRTIPTAPSRGVLGFSSGGFGAWHLATRNPDVFGAVAVLSGDSYFDLTHKGMVYDYLNRVWADKPNGPIEGDEMSFMVYALAACYSPNIENWPYFVDLPVDQTTGELVETTWEKWRSYDMVVNWKERQDHLRALRGILLDSGRHDEHGLQWGHRLVSHYLTKAGIDHDVCEHAGSHSGRSMERHQLALQWLASKLEHE